VSRFDRSSEKRVAVTRYAIVQRFVTGNSRSTPAPHWGQLASLAIALTVLAGCDGLLDVERDPHYVDVDKDPPQLAETIIGAAADLFFSYDVWMYESGMFAGDFVAVGRLRFETSTRNVSTAAGQSGGLTGGGRDLPGPAVAWYAYLQTAVSSAHAAQERILAGDFKDVSDPPNSQEYARVSVYKAYAMLWLSDMYCTIAFLGRGPELTSKQGYEAAAGEYQKALNAANADRETRQAALVGLARISRLLGDDAAARSFAQQVDPQFEFLATYSSTTLEQNNHIWFRTWSFGEHSVGPTYRNLNLENGAPDPRVRLEKNPVLPRGTDDDVYAPFKVPSAGSSLRLATGVEAQYIIAEAALQTDPQKAVDIINQIRTQRGVSLVWSPAGTGPNEIRDMLLEERRRTMFLEGTRMGDVRLYLERYQLDLFPTSIPQGVQMGTQICFPLPDRERENNPGLRG
jgi:hypothetical protein